MVLLFGLFVMVEVGFTMCSLNGYRPMVDKIFDEILKDIQEEQGEVECYV